MLGFSDRAFMPSLLYNIAVNRYKSLERRDYDGYRVTMNDESISFEDFLGFLPPMAAEHFKAAREYDRHFNSRFALEPLVTSSYLLIGIGVLLFSLGYYSGILVAVAAGYWAIHLNNTSKNQENISYSSISFNQKALLFDRVGDECERLVRKQEVSKDITAFVPILTRIRDRKSSLDFVTRLRLLGEVLKLSEQKATLGRYLIDQSSSGTRLEELKEKRANAIAEMEKKASDATLQKIFKNQVESLDRSINLISLQTNLHERASAQIELINVLCTELTASLDHQLPNAVDVFSAMHVSISQVVEGFHTEIHSQFSAVNELMETSAL